MNEPTVIVWEDPGCSMPTLGGFVLFGAIGALSARKGNRSRGAIDGVFGSWLGCAAANALGLRAGAASGAFALVGAWYAARLFDGGK